MADFGNPIGSIAGIALEHAPSVDEVVDYNYIYSIHRGIPGKVVKFDLVSFEAKEVATLASGDNFGQLSPSNIKAVKYGNHLYIPTYIGSADSRLVKFDYTTMTRISYLDLASEYPTHIILNDKYAYVGVRIGAPTYKNAVKKVDLDTFSIVATGIYQNSCSGAGYPVFMIPTGGTLYVVTTAGFVIRLNLETLEFEECLKMAENISGPARMAYTVNRDLTVRNFYFGYTVSVNNYVAKLFNTSPLKVAATKTGYGYSLDLEANEMDKHHRYAYWGRSNNIIDRFDLVNFEFVDSFTYNLLPAGKDWHGAVRIGDKLYISYGDGVNSTTMCEINLNSMEMERTHAYSAALNVDETRSLVPVKL